MTPLRYIRRAWKRLRNDQWVPCIVIPVADAYKVYNLHTEQSVWKHQFLEKDYYFTYDEAIACCRELNKE